MEDRFLNTLYFGGSDFGSQEIEEIMNSPLMEEDEMNESVVDLVPDEDVAPPSVDQSREMGQFYELEKLFKDYVEEQQANDLSSGDSIISGIWNGSVSVPMDEIQPRVPTETVVAPSMIQYDADPLLMALSKSSIAALSATGRASRRKSGLANIRCSETDAPIFVDKKPDEAELQLQVQSPRPRKRSLPVPSLQHPTSYKKIKKYELEDTENPSVRNARAAKANREKKKQEVVDLKTENQRKDVIIRDLNEDKQRLLERALKAEAENAKLTQQQQSSNGIVQVRDDLAKMLACIVPSLGQSFGPVPTVVLAPGLMAQEAGTRSINTQFNLDNGIITVSTPGSFHNFN